MTASCYSTHTGASYFDVEWKKKKKQINRAVHRQRNRYDIYWHIGAIDMPIISPCIDCAKPQRRPPAGERNPLEAPPDAGKDAFLRHLYSKSGQVMAQRKQQCDQQISVNTRNWHEKVTKNMPAKWQVSRHFCMVPTLTLFFFFSQIVFIKCLYQAPG